MADFEIVGTIASVQVIARGHGIRELARLNRTYGETNWRKLKGEATIRLPDGRLRRAEVHWYEGHGLGQRELKRKRYLE
jgi:hypothetical protein